MRKTIVRISHFPPAHPIPRWHNLFCSRKPPRHKLISAPAGFLYTTVGIHPCSALQFTSHPAGAASLLSVLETLCGQPSPTNPVVAFGEIGLDYDRLTHCPREQQLSAFASQLAVAITVQLPLFLHSRAAHRDFVRVLKESCGEELGKLPKRGVVHSFTGTREEMEELVALGFDIGINGCSLKTKENVDVVRAVPLNRLQIETDGPWCEIRASHAAMEFLADFPGEIVGEKGWSRAVLQGGKSRNGREEMEFKSVKKEKWVEGKMVKGRNEPCMIGRVAWAVAGIKGVPVEEVVQAAWANSVRMFGLGEV